MTDLRFRSLLGCLFGVLLSHRKPENEEHNSYAKIRSSFFAKQG